MNLWKIFQTTEYEAKLDKKTLVVLRWIAIGGQFLTINFVYFILGFNFPFITCFIIIFLGALTNIFLQVNLKKKFFLPI